MNRLRLKLNSSRGASFIIALVFMMICIIVASVIVIAAASNISKSENRMGEEQSYLAASSAAQIVADELEKLSYTAAHTDTKYHCNDAHSDVTGEWDVYSDDNADGSIASDSCAFADYINKWTLELVKNSKAQPSTATYTVSPQSNLSDKTTGALKNYETTVSLQMYSDFDLKAIVTVTDGTVSEEMTVTVQSEYQSSMEDVEKKKVVDENADEHAAGSYKVLVNGQWITAKTSAKFDIDYITYTRTINWGEPIISESN